MSRPDLFTFDFAPDTAYAAATATELSGLVVPYGQVITRMGVPITFERGSLELPEDLSTVKLLIQHDQDRPVGYATAATDTDAGLLMTLALTEHPRSQDLSSEVSLKLRDGLSVGVAFDEATEIAIQDAFWDGPDGPITVHGQLREVSAVSIPAFNDARATAGATGALATFSVEAPPAAPLPPVIAEPVQPDWTMAELAARVAPLLQTDPHPSAHPMSRFATFGGYYQAARDDAELARFALIDQITTNNPGVVPPGWLTEVKGIIAVNRPAVEALGGAGSLPDSGMDVNWPYFDGDLTLLVGEQVTQKTEITSVRVDLKKGTGLIKTYAGGSDVSYQLLTRSSPSYLEAYLRIMAQGYAIATDNVFADAITGAATTGPVWDPATGTADALRGALFASSALVAVATGSPATVVLVDKTMFAKLGGLAGLWPAVYGTNNVSGTADAASLQISIAGLRVVLDTNLAAGTILVTNEIAADWLESGPFPLAAEDVAKLGRNVGVWGMGATAVFLPKGIIKLPAV